jgi:Ca2+/Na+ antiporter
MAVSNSIGSNVFDILVGLALPWFVETAIVYPGIIHIETELLWSRSNFYQSFADFLILNLGSVSYINSRGLIYAIILLFLSLLITIYLFHRHHWTLNPQLGIGNAMKLY